MYRRETFPQAFVATHNIPYLCSEDEKAHPHSGGVLSRGQVVWANKLNGHKPHSVHAFVDGIGVVSLNPRWLAMAEAGGQNKGESHGSA